MAPNTRASCASTSCLRRKARLRGQCGRVLSLSMMRRQQRRPARLLPMSARSRPKRAASAAAKTLEALLDRRATTLEAAAAHAAAARTAAAHAAHAEAAGHERLERTQRVGAVSGVGSLGDKRWTTRARGTCGVGRAPRVRETRPAGDPGEWRVAQSLDLGPVANNHGLTRASQAPHGTARAHKASLSGTGHVRRTIYQQLSALASASRSHTPLIPYTHRPLSRRTRSCARRRRSGGGAAHPLLGPCGSARLARLDS